MRSLVWLCAGALVSFVSLDAFAKCSKDEPKNAVVQACKWIEEKGEGAVAEINKFRFCGSNYVWVQDTTDKILMVTHPTKPRLNKTSLLENKDENGFPLFKEFDKAAKAKKDGAWVDYLWAKPGAEKATAKTSFVKLCGGSLKWVAGSGVWKDEL